MSPITKWPAFSRKSPARHTEWEGDHHSTPYQTTFQRALVTFFKLWDCRRSKGEAKLEREGAQNATATVSIWEPWDLSWIPAEKT